MRRAGFDSAVEEFDLVARMRGKRDADALMEKQGTVERPCRARAGGRMMFARVEAEFAQGASGCVTELRRELLGVNAVANAGHVAPAARPFFLVRLQQHRNSFAFALRYPYGARLRGGLAAFPLHDPVRGRVNLAHSHLNIDVHRAVRGSVPVHHTGVAGDDVWRAPVM